MTLSPYAPLAELNRAILDRDVNTAKELGLDATPKKNEIRCYRRKDHDSMYIVRLARLYMDLSQRLDTIESDIKHAHEIEAAWRFLGFFKCSGIIEILKIESRPTPKIDGSFIEYRVNQLSELCREKWNDPRRELTGAIARLERKVDALAGAVGNALMAQQTAAKPAA